RCLGAGVRRMGVVRSRIDNASVNGTGYTVQPSDIGLTTKIEGFFPGQIGGGAILGFHVSAAISGNNAVIKCWKTGTAVSVGLSECANNEGGLNGLTAQCLVIGA